MICYDLKTLKKEEIQELCNLLCYEEIEFIVCYSEKTNYDILVIDEINLLSISEKVQEFFQKLTEI